MVELSSHKLTKIKIMPYKKSNKQIQDSAFKLRSGNTTPFKQMGSSPMKQKPIPTTGTESYKEYLDRAFKASKSPEGKDVMDRKGWKKGWEKSFDKWMSGVNERAKKIEASMPKKKGPSNYQKIMETLRARVPQKYHHRISNVSSQGKELIKKYRKGLMRGVQGAGGKALGTIGFFLGSMDTAKATQPGTGTHGGTKTPKLRDIDK